MTNPTGGHRVVIPSLDGLRALSIALVMAGHAIGDAPHSYLFRLLFLHSDLGVRIFFVISGFLITTLLLQEQELSGQVSLGLFYLRRGVRLLPAFVLYVSVVASLAWAGSIQVPSGYWVYVLTYTVNYSPYAIWVLGHLWSLSIEEQFYLLWPIAIRFAKPAVCVAIAMLGILAPPALRAWHPHWPVYSFPFVCGPLAMGCLMALGAAPLRHNIIKSKAFSSDWFLLPVCLAIFGLDSIPNDLSPRRDLIGILTNSLVTFCVARVVFVPGTPLGRFLNQKPLVIAGKLSYSLYLWQQLFLGPGKVPIPFPVPINLFLAVGVASLSYWGLESRFEGVRKRLRAPRSTS